MAVFLQDYSNNDMFRISQKLSLKTLCQPADSISRHEFLDALAEVCPAAASSKHNGRLPLGEKCHGHLIEVLLIITALAVSGGVDSMALALMCREYLPDNGISLHALVVDHGLRSASHDEATKVKQLLEQRLSMLPISSRFSQLRVVSNPSRDRDSNSTYQIARVTHDRDQCRNFCSKIEVSSIR